MSGGGVVLLVEDYLSAGRCVNSNHDLFRGDDGSGLSDVRVVFTRRLGSHRAGVGRGSNG